MLWSGICRHFWNIFLCRRTETTRQTYVSPLPCLGRLWHAQNKLNPKNIYPYLPTFQVILSPCSWPLSADAYTMLGIQGSLDAYGLSIDLPAPSCDCALTGFDVDAYHLWTPSAGDDDAVSRDRTHTRHTPRMLRCYTYCTHPFHTQARRRHT